MMKCYTLKWFDHLENMDESKTRKIHKSGIDAGNVKTTLCKI